MLNDEEYMQIKILIKQGKSIREISRILKMSRNTVRRYLKAEQKPSYKVRDKKISKVVPFHGYLQERVKAASPCCRNCLCHLRSVGREIPHLRHTKPASFVSRYKFTHFSR